MHAWCRAWMDPGPSGGRALWVVTMSHLYRLPWRSSFPMEGCAVYAPIPEVSYICRLKNEIAAIGKLS